MQMSGERKRQWFLGNGFRGKRMAIVKASLTLVLCKSSDQQCSKNTEQQAWKEGGRDTAGYKPCSPSSLKFFCQDLPGLWLVFKHVHYLFEVCKHQVNINLLSAWRCCRKDLPGRGAPSPEMFSWGHSRDANRVSLVSLFLFLDCTSGTYTRQTKKGKSFICLEELKKKWWEKVARIS